MTLCCTPRIESMAAAVTGRQRSLFADDLAARADDIAAAVAGRRVLVVGGAGSIGSATLLQLLAHRPAAVTVLDTSENNLAELVRSIRSAPEPFAGSLAVQPLDYGSPLAGRLLRESAPFDMVLSFAALKHVRSERDELSLTRMLEVNLLKADHFLSALRRHGHGRDGVFLVSTDKAANPVSLMGASKRAMELLLWSHASDDHSGLPPLQRVTSTRFANVAYSDGSLPWAFLQRIEKRQPLACPGDIRRFLVSPAEAGGLCLLSALVCPHRHLLIPRLGPDDQVTFTAIAEHTLAAFGLRPAWKRTETAARHDLDTDLAAGCFPVLVTTSDTSGEKEAEEFLGSGETARDIGLASCQAVGGSPPDRAALAAFLSVIQTAADGEPLDKTRLVEALRELVPGLRHLETGRSLDSKM